MNTKKRKSNKRTSNQLSEDCKSNGLIIKGKYIPEELLLEIFYNIDHKTLLSCQLVCKYWRYLIQRFVWHKKAERTIGRTLHFDKETPWIAYYCVCAEMPFNKNLLKNHSGQCGSKKNWSIPPTAGSRWFTESPPTPSLPNDPLILEKEHCFVTSSQMNWKYQIIDLVKEGFSEYLLDNLQPVIKISEFYLSQFVPALYVCDVELLKENGEKKLIYDKEKNQTGNTVPDCSTFSKLITNGEQNKWFKYEHELKNYGKGARKIQFIHGARHIHHHIHHHHNIDEYPTYGCKLARASVKVDLPSFDYKTIAALPKYE